ncbi:MULTISPECIES: hypothetical protein [unclassified Psychrobacter]|uniref:hypothetical protein n=1 Tax=unclassified Psychrobacter TaxID=196806 RepID=UPI00078B6B49|nr:hypothetical protein [Psychrobacter sp. P11G5]AMN67317.1 hypothetical protein AK825_06025 [Psychrobacter sp. P11G5]
MPPLKQTCFLKHIHLPKRQYPSNGIRSDIKPIPKRHFIYRKANALSLLLLIAALSFSTVGCATLQALEPTADLINDLKKIL